MPFMPRFVEVYDTDVYGRTRIYTGPGAHPRIGTGLHIQWMTIRTAAGALGAFSSRGGGDVWETCWDTRGEVGGVA